MFSKIFNFLLKKNNDKHYKLKQNLIKNKEKHINSLCEKVLYSETIQNGTSRSIMLILPAIEKYLSNFDHFNNYKTSVSDPCIHHEMFHEFSEDEYLNYSVRVFYKNELCCIVDMHEVIGKLNFEDIDDVIILNKNVFDKMINYIDSAYQLNIA